MFFRHVMNPKRTVSEIFYPESSPPWYNPSHHPFEIVNDVTGEVGHLGILMKSYISDAQDLWTSGRYDEIQYSAYLACICNTFAKKCESVMETYGPNQLISRYLKMKDKVQYHFGEMSRERYIYPQTTDDQTTDDEKLGEIQEEDQMLSPQKHIPGVA